MSPALKKKGRDDLGAGLRVSKDNIAAHPAGPPRYGELTQAERAFTLASTFLSGVLAYVLLHPSLWYLANKELLFCAE
jgi:hypothetical protein